MASLAEMQWEVTIERTQADLKLARQLGRPGGAKWQMTDSQIKAAKKLLASEEHPVNLHTFELPAFVLVEAADPHIADELPFGGCRGF